MLSGNFSKGMLDAEKNIFMKIQKAFYGSFSYLNGKTREQWDQIVYNQTYLSFTKGMAFPTVHIFGLFNHRNKDGRLKSYSDPDIANSWSLLNDIDLISFFNKTKVSFSYKTGLLISVTVNFDLIATLCCEEMSNKSF